MAKSPDAFRSISEVATWLGTQAHVLRFWESKFPDITPIKRAGGRRYYRPDDMRLIGGIKKLLHDDGMTIKAVQALLLDRGPDHVAQFSPPLEGEEPPVKPSEKSPETPQIRTKINKILMPKRRKSVNFTMNPLPVRVQKTPVKVKPMQPMLFPEMAPSQPKQKPTVEPASPKEPAFAVPNLFADHTALGADLPQTDAPLDHFPSRSGPVSRAISMTAQERANWLEKHGDMLHRLLG